jgi:hypothetical protein
VLGTVAAVVATFAGCSEGGADAPTRLMDGTRVRDVPIDLDGISGPAVRTAVAVVPLTRMRAHSRASACLEAWPDAEPRGPVVERVGVASATVTFAGASGIHGCDDSPGAREGDRRWCGTSFGLHSRTRLEDPRLDIAGCRTSAGKQMAFAWIDPAPNTRYVGIEQDRYAEIYEPAGSLPIRIATTTGVDVDSSRATFRLAEHDARGKLVRRYELQAVPAG